MNEVRKGKAVFLGVSGVGKTSLIRRYLDGKFDSASKHTIGVDFRPKHVTRHDIDFVLMIWDTAGQERYQCLMEGYTRDADFVLVCYDIASPSSFNRLDTILKKLGLSLPSHTVKYLIACKLDLLDGACDLGTFVSTDVARKYAKDRDMSFLETSSKTGDGVTKPFDTIFNRMYLKEKRFNEEDRQDTRRKQRRRRNSIIVPNNIAIPKILMQRPRRRSFCHKGLEKKDIKVTFTHTRVNKDTKSCTLENNKTETIILDGASSTNTSSSRCFSSSCK
ncbi:MAG: Rab family GTPase [Promethearchaeota archaeon]